jgi:hypothetical protein
MHSAMDMQKKCSRNTLSTNVPIFCELCPVVQIPVVWKYMMATLQAAHPTHWPKNNDSGIGVNIPEQMSLDMQIGHDELVAIGIRSEDSIPDSAPHIQPSGKSS